MKAREQSLMLYTHIRLLSAAAIASIRTALRAQPKMASTCTLLQWQLQTVLHRCFIFYSLYVGVFRMIAFFYLCHYSLISHPFVQRNPPRIATWKPSLLLAPPPEHSAVP